MPSKFKARVRARRVKTGEKWAAAERHVRAAGAAANLVGEGKHERAPEPVGGKTETAAGALNLAYDGEYEDASSPAKQAEDASELASDGEREDYLGDELETEECATKAEALSAARRFGQAQQRQGYQVSIHDEVGLISVWVKRAVPAPNIDLAEDEKRFTFPTEDEDSGDGEERDEGGGEPQVLIDSPRPMRNALAGSAPHPLHSLPELLDALALSQTKLEALTAADASLYQRFTVPKRDRSRREFAKPVPPLMAVQRRILKLIVERLPAHDASHGFRVGRSTQTNAAVHINSKVVVTVDLRNFSSAITLPRVLGVFRHAGYPDDVARALALLCTAPDPAGRCRLPQGAPTTPGLSNAVCFRLDCRLTSQAARQGWRYTRYGDDLTFSMSAGEAKPAAGEMLSAIGRIVAGEGFRIHSKKMRVTRSGNSQRVTGLVVNGPGAPRVPREVRRRQRAAAYNLRRKGETAP